MDWSSFIAPGIVGGLLGLYLKGISQRIDDLKTSTAKQFEETGKRLDETNRRLDALQTEVTSQGKALARIEGRLDPYDMERNRSE